MPWKPNRSAMCIGKLLNVPAVPRSCERERKKRERRRKGLFLRVWACSACSACLAWSRMSLCEHGRRRRQSDECGSASICEHGRQRYLCKDCGGKSICCCCHERRAWSTAATAVLRARSEPQPVQGVRSQQHLRAREAAQRLQGVRQKTYSKLRWLYSGHNQRFSTLFPQKPSCLSVTIKPLKHPAFVSFPIRFFWQVASAIIICTSSILKLPFAER